MSLFHPSYKFRIKGKEIVADNFEQFFGAIMALTYSSITKHMFSGRSGLPDTSEIMHVFCDGCRAFDSDLSKFFCSDINPSIKERIFNWFLKECHVKEALEHAGFRNLDELASLILMDDRETLRRLEHAAKPLVKHFEDHLKHTVKDKEIKRYFR